MLTKKQKQKISERLNNSIDYLEDCLNTEIRNILKELNFKEETERWEEAFILAREIFFKG